MENTFKPRFNEQAHTVIRLNHYSNRTKSSAETGTTISYTFIHCDA